MTTATMGDDDNNVDGDSATGNKVDDDDNSRMGDANDDYNDGDNNDDGNSDGVMGSSAIGNDNDD